MPATPHLLAPFLELEVLYLDYLGSWNAHEVLQVVVEPVGLEHCIPLLLGLQLPPPRLGFRVKKFTKVLVSEPGVDTPILPPGGMVKAGF